MSDRRRTTTDGAVPLENLELLDSEVHHLRGDVQEYRDEAKTLSLRVGSLEVRIEGQTKVLERVEESVKNARNIVAGLVVSLLLALVGVMLKGCAHQQPRPQEKTLELAGGAVSAVLEQLTGQKVDAFTLPGGTVVYLGEPDECLQAHEAVHVGQQMELGVREWAAAYARELLRVGYRDNPFEVQARAAQAECEARQTERPP